MLSLYLHPQRLSSRYHYNRHAATLIAFGFEIKRAWMNSWKDVTLSPKFCVSPNIGLPPPLAPTSPVISGSLQTRWELESDVSAQTCKRQPCACVGRRIKQHTTLFVTAKLSGHQTPLMTWRLPVLSVFAGWADL